MSCRQAESRPDMLDAFVPVPSRNEVLETLATLIDWRKLSEGVAATYKSGGRVGFDPVLMIKLLVLQRLYALSDGRLVEEAADRLSFRVFLGLRSADRIPDDTTVVRFRSRLRTHKVFDALMKAFDEQLAERGVKAAPGSITLVDATLIPSAVNAPPRAERPKKKKKGEADSSDALATPSEVPNPSPSEAAPVAAPATPLSDATPLPETASWPGPAPDASASPVATPVAAAASTLPETTATPPVPRPSPDPDANFGTRGGPWVFGFKLHSAQDRRTGLITAYKITKASVADITVFGVLLKGDEAEVLADKGYDSEENRSFLRDRGIVDSIMHTRRRNTPNSDKELERNLAIRPRRGFIEGTFSTLKRTLGCARASCLGLERVTEMLSMAVLAYNLRRATAIIRAAA